MVTRVRRLVVVGLVLVGLSGCAAAAVVVDVLVGTAGIVQREQHRRALEDLRAELAAGRPVAPVANGPEQVAVVACPPRPTDPDVCVRTWGWP